MKISGFTIVRNARKYNYPMLESIRSILAICDEFIVNVGDSDDDTLELVRSLRDPKVRIVQSRWDLSAGKEVLSIETNKALSHCQGDWAFYLQSDEVIHEDDLPKLRRIMEECLSKDIDALRFSWLHFYGSYYRYRIDRGWYQKQDRIIRNNGRIESFGDAFGFRRRDGQPLKRKTTGCLLYHYGWVQPQDVMTSRRVNAETIGFTSLQANERKGEYDYGDLDRFPVYFGRHPKVMEDLVNEHALSRRDWEKIRSQNRLNPFIYLRPRFKTFQRVKEELGK